MEMRTWEKTGVKTTLLGFGCMRFPTLENGKINEDLAVQMLDLAYRSGVNYYDTAYRYHDGDSELLVGKWLDQHPRDSYYLTTKLPVMMIQSLEQAKEIFEEQRQKLHKDYFDFYLLHALNKNTFTRARDLGIIDYCETLKKEGKIRNLGFSFHDDYSVFEEILNYRQWDLCQIQLNYMDTREQAGLKGYQLTEKMGVPLVIMEPVKGGSLAKLPDNIASEFKKVRPDASLSSWALRWVASLPNVKVVLSGMSAPEHVMDNLKTFTDFQPISQEEQAAIDKVAGLIRERVFNGCTDCRYCLPCPNGVNIPKNFAVWNRYGMYNNVPDTRFQWMMMMPEAEKAKNCVECGECETKCPQKLNIRHDLAALQKVLDQVAA